MKQTKTLLWLDDVRNPSHYDLWVRQYLGDQFEPSNKDTQIVWVKSYDQFYLWIKQNGMPDVIGFDHDLGGKMSGADAAELVCNICVDDLLPLPEYFVQSANPVGRRNGQVHAALALQCRMHVVVRRSLFKQ